MSMAEFTDLITIAEMTPGPISINSATFVGTRLAGPLGALICTLGCIIPSFFICLLLAHFIINIGILAVFKKYYRFETCSSCFSCFSGIIYFSIRLFNSDMAAIHLDQFRVIEFILFVGALFLLRKYKMNAILIIFGTGIIGTLMYLPIVL